MAGSKSLVCSTPNLAWARASSESRWLRGLLQGHEHVERRGIGRIKKNVVADEHFVVETKIVETDDEVRLPQLVDQRIDVAFRVDLVRAARRAVGDADRHPHVPDSVPAADFIGGLLGFKIEIDDVLHGARGRRLHAHDLVTRVNINHLPGDGRRAVAGQKRSRGSEFLRQDVAFERRVGLVMLEHFGEAGDAAGGQRIDRAGADAVDANLFRTQIIGEVSRGSFQRSLRPRP